MNKISKELKIEVSEKVYKALGQSDEIILQKANLKYKAKVEKIVRLRREYESEVQSLSTELKSQGLRFEGYDENKIELSSSYERDIATDLINKVIVKLQYSKEPDLLSSIDKIVQDLKPKENKMIEI